MKGKPSSKLPSELPLGALCVRDGGPEAAAAAGKVRSPKLQLLSIRRSRRLHLLPRFLHRREGDMGRLLLPVLLRRRLRLQAALPAHAPGGRAEGDILLLQA